MQQHEFANFACFPDWRVNKESKGRPRAQIKSTEQHRNFTWDDQRKICVLELKNVESDAEYVSSTRSATKEWIKD